MREPFQQRAASLLVWGCCLLALVAQAPKLAVRWFARAPAVVIERPEITVSVAGEVFRPGDYRLEFGSRVADLLAAAGGMTRAAASELVNPADPLTDGEQVYIPNHVTHLGSQRVPLNSASLAELDSLPGIGPVMAQRIVDHRPFSSVEDLLRVPGVGGKTLERLRALVTL